MKFLVLSCLLFAGGPHCAFAARNQIDLGPLVKDAPTPLVADSHRELLPARVFDVILDGTVTFDQAMQSLGDVIVRKFEENATAPRYICYRSARGKPAVFAIYVSRSAAQPDTIDGFAFGLLSAIPAAAKLCRQVPWLKAGDLHFDKVSLDMPQEKFLALFGTLPSTDEQISVQWKKNGEQPASPAPVSAVFKDAKLVFLRVFSPPR